MKLVGTESYVSLAFDHDQRLVLRNYLVETPELFEQVKVSDEHNTHFTVICIRSVFNQKFVKIVGQENFVLKADEDELVNADQFIIYYGPDKNVGLKSKSTGNFVNILKLNNDSLVAASSDNLVDSLIFEYEYSELPLEYPVYDLVRSFQPQIQIATIEK